MRIPARRRLAVVLFMHAFTAVCPAADPVDHVRFGDAASEKAHAFDAPRAEVFTDGAGRAARRVLANDPPRWDGGLMAFTVKVDPVRQNYATVRFNGDEATDNRLMLYIDGQQIGYRHLGDIDIIDQGGGQQPAPGCDVFVTIPLPRALTKDKTSARLELRASGRIWGYGKDLAQFQKDMETPSRALHALYIHTGEYFAPPDADARVGAFKPAVARNDFGPDAVDRLRARVRHELAKLMRGGPAHRQTHLQLLAHAYRTPGSDLYNDPRVVERVVASVDAIWRKFKADPKAAEREPGTDAGDWIGAGQFAESVWLVAGALADKLDEALDGDTPRRDAWAALFAASRDFNRRTRRMYANQTMIKDLYGIYLNNKALLALGSDLALPEDLARRYLLEAVGCHPWSGSGLDDPRDKKLPPGAFAVFTPKGLTRELGYVGNYGEVLDWMRKIYDATREPAITGDGDPAIRDRLVKALHARAAFRYPGRDADGFRALRIEAAVGWRDGDQLPGHIAYAERDGWDGSPISAVAATLDPQGIAYVRQMIDDGQFYAYIDEKAKRAGFRGSLASLQMPGDLEKIWAAPRPEGVRLPMSSGQPDFVFADETNGVVAIRHGEEILYASLYWRARHAVNFLGRVHYITPGRQHVATVFEDIAFTPNNKDEYVRPNWTTFGFDNGGGHIKYQDIPPSAHRGAREPVARVPAGLPYKVGQENMFVGRGDLYRLTYGPYFIAMNMTEDRTLVADIPAAFQRAEALYGEYKTGQSVHLPPQRTLVLRQCP